MATRYIDLNASNSLQINETNNRYRVKLNQTEELPAGTQVEVQSSLVNLQGITGQSIEFEKDFEETIMFNYYAVDTTYPTPALSIGNPADITSFDIYPDMRYNFNPTLFAPFQFSDAVIPSNGGNFKFYETFPFGFTENIMPLCGTCFIRNNQANESAGGAPTDADRYLVPLCGKADIKIPKGIYSVASLGELITEQINATVGTDDQINFYDRRKVAGTYKGNLVNNTTNRMVGTTDISLMNIYVSGGNYPTQFVPDIPDGVPRALGVDDNTAFGAIAVRPEHMNDIFFQAKNNIYNTTVLPDTAKVDQCFRAGALNPGGNLRYGFTFQSTNAENEDFNQYNVFTNGTGVGTTGMKISYDSEKSGFSISHLHEPRRIPTTDRRGNQMSNPSAECVYSKRVYQPLADFTQTGITPVAVNYYEDVNADNQALAYRTLNAVMQRYTGIQVYNWGFKTALAQGDVDALNVSGYNTKNPNNKDFWNFNDFFSTPELAKKAWEETLWFRLGFTYDQLCNPDNYLNQEEFDNPQQIQGTTTGADIDSSIIPFISTNYNDYGENQPTGATPTKDQFQLLPNVNTVQLFNLLDVNVPRNIYNNNKNLTVGSPPTPIPACITPYIGSFYNYAVMFPVQTTGLDIVAANLPRLSINGYMLVLSDIINQNDQAGKTQELGILDVIPKSSLSNQDFIANRNNLIHILSNPKTVNEIVINIVNPDLTDVLLQPNSSILLKITKPLEKPTIVMANSETEFAESEIKQEVLQEIQQQQKATKKQSK